MQTLDDTQRQNRRTDVPAVRENLTATLAIFTAGQTKQTELVARLEDRFAESSSVPNDVTFASRLRLLRDNDRADLCRRDPIGINARCSPGSAAHA